MKHLALSKKKKFHILNWLLLAFAFICLVIMFSISSPLHSQKAAERWQGEGELEFSQLSFYIPESEKLDVGKIFSFRYAMLDKFREAALDVSSSQTLFCDAWSTGGKVKISSATGQGEVYAIAVGGSFFNFHPVRLLSGSYINETDLMQDRVLLDEDTAWLLFGGTELQGMNVKINGVPFVVAGVISREDDRATDKAYTHGMGIFMSFEAYSALKENAGISCYELVMAEPVENFAYNFADEKFPIGGGEIVKNTGRYSPEALFKVIKDFGSRSMQTHGVIYPYWENAARYIEDWCALLMLLAVLAVLMPAVNAVLWLRRGYRRGKRRLSENVVPRIRDSAEEAIRVRQRRRWEKKRGLHEK